LEEIIKKYPSVERFSLDRGYRGTTKNFLEKICNKVVNIAEEKENTWAVSEFRWVIERTIAWLCNYRRLSKDYEYSIWAAENFIYLANISIILKKLF
jgi:putative transposase